MALADLAAYKTAVESGVVFPLVKGASVAVANRLFSTWLNTPDAGATPSTAAVCTRDTVGALLTQPRLSAFTNPIYLAQAEVASAAPTAAACLILCDRLSHQGGLSGTATTTTTTNLPTAALTRYTDGAGVFAALEIYTSLGAAAVTITASYTNQGGTSGRTTKAVAWGGGSNNVAGMFFPLPLQDDDTGVRSVESVTPSSSTTAGTFGVTLYKPLAVLPLASTAAQGVQPYHWDGLLCGGSKLVEADDNACLFALTMATAGNVTYAGALTLIEVA